MKLGTGTVTKKKKGILLFLAIFTLEEYEESIHFLQTIYKHVVHN